MNGKGDTYRPVSKDYAKKYDQIEWRRKLISLETWNTGRRKIILDDNPKQNGIKCPDCGLELYDIDRNSILTSLPPQTKIWCDGCHYTGFRVL